MSVYDKRDFWAEKAKKEGYPARSVYKLAEIDEKFKFFKESPRILEIGAAPGSWSLWTLKRLKGRGFLAAVDLQELKIVTQYENFFFIQGDLYDKDVKAKLSEYGPFDIVMSDAAPSTSGNSGLDTDRSEAIVEAVLAYADDFLKPGGTVLAKLFIGGGQRELMERMKTSYKQVRAFKPKACRSISFETYLLGTDKIKTN